MEDLIVAPGWVVPRGDLAVQFSRSGGPGGQNVNKLNTRVELRLMLATRALDDAQRARLAARFPSQVTLDGELLIQSDEHRSQRQNMETAFDRLRAMLLAIRRAPRARRPTKPSRASKERRIGEKKRRGEVKRGRTKLE